MICVAFYQAANINYIFVFQNNLTLNLRKTKNIRLSFAFFSLVFLLLLVFTAQSRLQAQTESANVVGIYGILMSSDTLRPIPDAQIFSRDNYLGSFSDTTGGFTSLCLATIPLCFPHWDTLQKLFL